MSSAATMQENFEMVVSMIRNITVKLASRTWLRLKTLKSLIPNFSIR